MADQNYKNHWPWRSRDYDDVIKIIFFVKLQAIGKLQLKFLSVSNKFVRGIILKIADLEGPVTGTIKWENLVHKNP